MKGTPDLHLKGFRLWVHDREFPEAQDYWTGNWLVVSAELHTGHGWARVRRAACVMTADFARFLAQVKHEDAKTETSLWELTLQNPFERELSWTVSKTAEGLQVSLSLSANPAHEWHSVRLSLKETEWLDFKVQVRQLVERYPVRSTAEEGEHL